MVMPVVVPLKDKPLTDCLHVSWEVSGYSKLPDGDGIGLAKEHRKCSDCGHQWSEVTDEWPEPTAEPEAPGKPPKAVYGHAQVVTYQTEKGQYDLVVGELAMVSTQNGLIVVQHHDAPVVGIVGVRPWLEEDKSDGADAEG